MVDERNITSLVESNVGNKRTTPKTDPSDTSHTSPESTKDQINTASTRKRRKVSEDNSTHEVSTVVVIDTATGENSDANWLKQESTDSISSYPADDQRRNDLSNRKTGGVEILGKSYNCVNEFKDWNGRSHHTNSTGDNITPRIKLKFALTDQRPKRGVLSGDRICNWRGCKKQTRIECANSGCEKLACDRIHSYLVCLECTTKQFDRFNVTAKPESISSVKCKVVAQCKNRTTRVCRLAECRKAVCEVHRYKLCQDCCFNSEYNFQVYD